MEPAGKGGQVNGHLPHPLEGSGMASGEMPPNALFSPFFQPHLHGASGMWALPTDMVSVIHSLLCFTKCPVPTLPALLAVWKERGRGKEGSICPGTSAYQPKLWAS